MPCERTPSGGFVSWLPERMSVSRWDEEATLLRTRIFSGPDFDALEVQKESDHEKT